MNKTKKQIAAEIKRKGISFSLEGERNKEYQLQFAIEKLKKHDGTYTIWTQDLYEQPATILVYPSDMISILEKRLKEHQREIKKLEFELSKLPFFPQ